MAERATRSFRFVNADSGRLCIGPEVLIEVRSGSALHEFAIRWHDVGRELPMAPRVEVSDDAWPVFVSCADLFAWLATQERSSVTPMQVCAKLVGLGFSEES